MLIDDISPIRRIMYNRGLIQLLSSSLVTGGLI